MPTMIGPQPFQTIQAFSATYTANAAGVFLNVAANDVTSMQKAGCDLLGIGAGSGALIGLLIGANMNVTTDQQIPMFNGGQPFRVTKISVKNASVSLTTAQGSIYPAVSKAGTALTSLGATTVYTGLTTNALAIDLILTPVLAIQYPATQQFWLSLTTAQGAAATADFFVYGDMGS